MTSFERSVAFWLRAYPLRWRAARSAEVAAVLADLAGPAPHRLDARAAIGLVRGGWATGGASTRRSANTCGTTGGWR